MAAKDKTRVGKVTVHLGTNPREYSDCWINVDHQSRLVHIWRAQRDVHPAVSAPIQSVIIDWCLVEPVPLAPPAR